ncbi:MAG: cyclic nucleotide-binding domain-containing protein [Elusimicrobiaceae bacterium]
MSVPDCEKLKKISFFEKFSDAELAALCARLKPRACAAGEIIFRENETGDSLYLVAESSVRVDKCVSEEGEQYCSKILAVINPGDFLGEMALIDEQHRSATATALEPTQLLELQKEDFDGLSVAMPATSLALYSAMTKALSFRLRATSTELAMLYDISELVFKTFDSEKAFLAKLLSELRLHLGHNWRLAAYSYNIFNEENELAGVCGPGQLEGAPGPDRLCDQTKGWLDQRTYIAQLPGKIRPDGYLLFQSPRILEKKERDSLEIAFSTVARIANSVVDRIRYATEETLRKRLEHSRHDLF